MTRDSYAPVIQELSARLRAAHDAQSPLRIRGGGTRDFYGRTLHGEALDDDACRGIVDYEPTKLVLTARAGTPLAEVEAILAREGQMLAFEPPRFGAGSTLGGAIATGFSGPRRLQAGSARDFVLGVRLLDGCGADLRFGGQVMKNVAGFDVSRLVTGSLGTLGVLLEVSLKVLPLPPAEATIVLEANERDALTTMNRWAGQPLPISATAVLDHRLYVRLSGAAPAVTSAQRKLGGEALGGDAGVAFWTSLRDQTHPFFTGDAPLWRLALPSVAPPLKLNGATLVEWTGAQRWVRGDLPVSVVREAAARHGGHATLFRHGDKTAGVFHPLSGPLQQLQRKLKHALDPAGILNRGRMYAEF